MDALIAWVHIKGALKNDCIPSTTLRKNSIAYRNASVMCLFVRFAEMKSKQAGHPVLFALILYL
jgi:hypothetical protein